MPIGLRPVAKKVLLRSSLTLVLVYSAFAGFISWAMRQPPEKFGSVMAHMPDWVYPLLPSKLFGPGPGRATYSPVIPHPISRCLSWIRWQDPTVFVKFAAAGGADIRQLHLTTLPAGGSALTNCTSNTAIVWRSWRSTFWKHTLLTSGRLRAMSKTSALHQPQEC